jgi:hypothetical protein
MTSLGRQPACSVYPCYCSYAILYIYLFGCLLLVILTCLVSAILLYTYWTLCGLLFCHFWTCRHTSHTFHICICSLYFFYSFMQQFLCGSTAPMPPFPTFFCLSLFYSLLL